MILIAILNQVPGKIYIYDVIIKCGVPKFTYSALGKGACDFSTPPHDKVNVDDTSITKYFRLLIFGQKIILFQCVILWCLLNVPPRFNFIFSYQKWPNSDVKSVMSCQVHNYSLSRFCCQNHFPRPNAHFRLCFANLWGLVKDITSDPHSNLNPVYYALKSIKLRTNVVALCYF